MHPAIHPDPRNCLLPEGRRWGLGARSVLPYLAAVLDSRPGEAAPAAGAIRNPVFSGMENLPRVREPRH